MTNAFLTGSRAYGTPREDSDTDLCVLLSDSDMDQLERFAPCVDGENEYGGHSGVSLRFGRLNLLCFSDADVFGAWKEATAELIARKPVTRDNAVKAIDAKLAVVINARWVAEGEALSAMEKDLVTGELHPGDGLVDQVFGECEL